MDFAAAVERKLQGALEHPEPDTLRSAARLLCLSSTAKRARPLLVERLGALLGTPPERLLPIAAAVELIHSASLLHDDVIDRALERRGQPSANAVYGNRVAVLAGDLLIALALELLRPLPAGVTAAATDAIAAMTRAAMLEIERARDAGLDEDAWRAIARGKTGSLLAFCGRAVGLEAGEEEAAGAFAHAAEQLGIAFQAADDLADLQEGTGKPRFQDLRHGNPSLLIAIALTSDAALAADVGCLWEQAGEQGVPALIAEELGERLARGGAKEIVKARIGDYVRSGLMALEPWLRDEAGDELIAWGRALLSDDFFRRDERTP